MWSVGNKTLTDLEQWNKKKIEENSRNLNFAEKLIGRACITNHVIFLRGTFIVFFNRLEI